jgi:hypothetical protein
MLGPTDPALEGTGVRAGRAPSSRSVHHDQAAERRLAIPAFGPRGRAEGYERLAQLYDKR